MSTPAPASPPSFPPASPPSPTRSVSSRAPARSRAGGRAPAPGLVPRALCARDVQGIVYFADETGQVYKHEHVVAGTPDPAVIGRLAPGGDEIVFVADAGQGQTPV